jgi:uncharacterized membrane protein YphA (DoxX/SURF4 family)
MSSKHTLTFLRISMGAFMFLHGAMKLLEGPSFWQNLGSLPPWMPDHLAIQMSGGIIATVIELLGGAMIIAGYRVRLAACFIAVLMLMAFTYHLPNVNSFSTFMYNAWPLEIACVFIALAIDNPLSSKGNTIFDTPKQSTLETK